MAGKFKRSRYKTDDGRVFSIRIQPETELLSFGSQQNAPTVNPVSEKERLAVRRDVREVGIKTRKVGITWVSGQPATYAPGAFLYVPILTPEIFSAIQLGQGVTYLGGLAEVNSLVPER